MDTVYQLYQFCTTSYDKNPPGFIDIDDLRFGVLPYENNVVLVFRGSANISNWLRDFFVIPKKSIDGYWIHGGIADAVMALKDRVEEALCGKKLAAVTGHSLGGGLAREFARLYRVPAVTFGCPRIDFRFGADPQCDHLRIVCDDDPVPMVPRVFYNHNCAPVTLKDSDHQVVNPGDHNIDVYGERIKNVKIFGKGATDEEIYDFGMRLAA